MTPTATSPETLPELGVVIVTFNSADVILDCLESLLASAGVRLDIVVVDNASTDGTVDLLRAWADGSSVYVPATDLPFLPVIAAKPLALLSGVPDKAGSGHSVTLLDTGLNAGFAAGVNQGLALLAKSAGYDRFWVINPDCLVPPGAALAFASQPSPGFSLMGGRVLYCPSDAVIQIDGGTLNQKTGVTGNVHQYRPHASTPAPSLDQMDFITGASMVVSRQFYEAAGPMPEDYFLYYEEVDWALRRGDLPLAYCPGGVVYHRAGTAIGSPGLGRPATPFSLYFKHRGRLRFIRRYFPRALPYAYAYSLAKAAELLLRGYPTEARTLLGASFGLSPSAAICSRLSPDAAALAFAKRR